ncbi:GNAT family N-acetyltransferase [Brumimicrobium oceani]|uniref:GNAT family N-acetyltransferase n=1 Tax=Brumimicrobium oceani TaxID=2100725 RepID=A0A2U2XFW6_9FLAO|nr:GNAT family N-acetyltransferase [Brumimicrobium oceani]PWH86647.1 GNAT family N-acetyltransferase [Brumimicrobium oceani]
MKLSFRKASMIDVPMIWDILSSAIARRKADGSDQWQDGYPNKEVVNNDIENGVGFVLTENEKIAGYCAVLINDEPEYANIEGEWLSSGDFVVYHRVAIAENYLGRGLAKKMLKFIEEFALENKIYSVKADTNFDNEPMLFLFEQLGYKYCGEVYFRGKARKAYEKNLVNKVNLMTD